MADTTPLRITTSPEAPKDEYLGDGVYASFDGYQIWLANGHHERRVIALEPAVLEALDRYRAKVKAYADAFVAEHTSTPDSLSREEDNIYWLSHVGERDDFGAPIGSVIYDACTRNGQWALMSHESWENHRRYDTLGTGKGQKFAKQDDGRWLKVEG